MCDFFCQGADVYAGKVAGSHDEQHAVPVVFRLQLPQQAGVVGEHFQAGVRKATAHVLRGDFRQAFVPDHFRVEEYQRFVGSCHGVGVLGQEGGVQAAEGVQLHAGDEAASGVLFPDGFKGCLELGRGVGEVEEYGDVLVFRHFLQPFGSSFVCGDGLEEVPVADAGFAAGKAGCGDVLQVVPPEDAERCFAIEQKAGCPVFDFVGEGAVRQAFDGGGGMGCHCPDIFIAFVINEGAAGGDLLHELLELFHIVFEGGKDVHVVPGDAGEDGDVGVVMQEFGGGVDGRGEVFIAFEHGKAAVVREVYHGVEAFELRPCHVVKSDPAVAEHVHNHGGGGGFAVAASDDNPPFVAGLFVEVFRVAVYPDA